MCLFVSRVVLWNVGAETPRQLCVYKNTRITRSDDDDGDADGRLLYIVIGIITLWRDSAPRYATQWRVRLFLADRDESVRARPTATKKCQLFQAHAFDGSARPAPEHWPRNHLFWKSSVL